MNDNYYPSPKNFYDAVKKAIVKFNKDKRHKRTVNFQDDLDFIHYEPALQTFDVFLHEIPVEIELEEVLTKN